MNRPTDAAFPEAAKAELANQQLRRNLGHATQTIRAKRAAVVAELPDWEELRKAGRALKTRVLRHLDDYLLACTCPPACSTDASSSA